MSLARFKILVLITIVVKQLAKIGHTFINKVRLAACDEVKSRFLGKLKTQFAKKPALYYIAIGNKDFLFQANSDYRKMLDEKGYKYEYYETGEGHIWKNWRIYLTEFAPKIFK